MLIIYSQAFEFFDQKACCPLTATVASGACNQGPKACGDTQWWYANKSAAEIRSKINLWVERRRDKDTTKYRSHEKGDPKARTLLLVYATYRCEFSILCSIIVSKRGCIPQKKRRKDRGRKRGKKERKYQR